MVTILLQVETFSVVPNAIVAMKLFRKNYIPY